MKAWIVRIKDEYEATIVFAPTRGKAKSIALHSDCFSETDFTELQVRRIPKADNQYRGNEEMDWFDNRDRMFLVKECGFTCEWTDSYCLTCYAKDYCFRFQDELDKLEEYQEENKK